jgi:hypothetical protein
MNPMSFFLQRGRIAANDVRGNPKSRLPVRTGRLETRIMRLDHIVVAAESLDDGAARVAAALGVPLETGGAHLLMGTHNRLLSLGAGEYLEVIAIDPAATRPAHPRWFGLDQFAGPARLAAWVCATDDLDAAVAALPGAGAGVPFSRGDFVWRFAVPPEGATPFDGCQPALIAWESAAHPAARLPDRGCRLHRLRVIHPEGEMLAHLLAPVLHDPRISVESGPEVRLFAEIGTQAGLRVLG